MTKVVFIKDDHNMKKNISFILLSAVLLSGCNSDKIQNKTSSVCETSAQVSQTDIVSENTVCSEETLFYESTTIMNSDDKSEAISMQEPQQTTEVSIDTPSIVETDIKETSISYEITEVLDIVTSEYNNGESDEGGIH